MSGRFAGFFLTNRSVTIPLQFLELASVIEKHDVLIIRCPQLGGEVPFRYCRTVNEDLPCRKIMVCWEFRLKISEFLGEHYSIDQIQSALVPPTKTRLDTILEIIEEAKKEGGE